MARTQLTPKIKLMAARAMIRDRMPYFTTLIDSAVYVWLEPGSLNTMAVTKDGAVLLDEKDINELGIEQVAISLLHELAGHFLRDHASRKPEGCDAHLWNLAGDAEINDDLKAANWKIQDFPKEKQLFMPENLGAKDGLIAEQYYQELRKQQSKQPQQGGKGAPQCGHGWCGSGAGRPAPNEPGQDGKIPGQKDAEGNDRKIPVRGKGYGDRVRKGTAEAIQKYEKHAGRGSVPGGWSRWADDMLEPPKIDWRSKLNQLVRDACAYRPGAVVTSWKRFGRRQAALGFGPGRPMIPSWRNPVPVVAVCVDTSGSMGPEELKMAVSETDGILRAVQADVKFLAIDSAIHGFTPVHNIADVASLLKGGGGTDFRPAFEYLEKAAEKTEVVIFITDGDGPAPARKPPGMRVIWVLTGNHARKPYFGEYGGQSEGWGDFIKISSTGELMEI